MFCAFLYFTTRIQIFKVTIRNTGNLKLDVRRTDSKIATSRSSNYFIVMPQNFHRDVAKPPSRDRNTDSALQPLVLQTV